MVSVAALTSTTWVTSPVSKSTSTLVVLLINTSTFLTLEIRKPAFCTRTLYIPGMRVWKRKVPDSEEFWVWLPMGPVMVTVAPGTTAFVGSYTIPLKLPRAAPWSWAITGMVRIRNRAAASVAESNHFDFNTSSPSQPKRLAYKVSFRINNCFLVNQETSNREETLPPALCYA